MLIFIAVLWFYSYLSKLSNSFSLSLSIYIYIYTPEQKYKTTIKNEEKDIVYNFLIMKLRYMKDKFKRYSNLK